MDFSGLVGGLKKQGAEAFGNVLGRTGQINWASPSWDLFIFGFFVSAVILFMFSLSRERIFLTLLSTYITLAVVKGFDGFAQLFFAVVNIWFWQIIIFLIVLIIITALLSRLSISGGSGFVSLWQFFLFFSSTNRTFNYNYYFIFPERSCFTFLSFDKDNILK